MLIKTLADLEQAIANGPYAWPGGYPVYFICQDGAPLSFESVLENRTEIDGAFDGSRIDPEWRVVAVEVNWEDPDLYCAHSGKRIESAYAEPENDSPARPELVARKRFAKIPLDSEDDSEA